MPVTQPSSLHAQHDALLIAKLAANDVNSPERVQAMALIAECQECADLRRDLEAITIATRALPAPVRRHDFRLTEADAAQLRRPTWRDWLERLAAPRFAYTQRVGAGLAALGIAGLLFASNPSALFTGTQSTTLEHAGAPVGASRSSTDNSAAGPSAPATDKSGGSGTPEPATVDGSGVTSESIASDQTAAPSAAAGAAAIPAPTTAPTAPPQFAPTAAPTAGSLSAPSAPPTAAPTTAPSLQQGAPVASAAPAESTAPQVAPLAPIGTAPPAASAPPAAQATGDARGVPQGVSPTAGRDAGSGSGLGLSPLALVSILLFLLGLGLLLARRVAVSLTSR